MWAIKDVVSHMIATTGFFLNSVTRALQGDELPPEGAPNPGVGNAATMGAGIASRAIQISETDFHNYNSSIFFSPGLVPVNCTSISKSGSYPDKRISSLAISIILIGSPISKINTSPPSPNDPACKIN